MTKILNGQVAIVRFFENFPGEVEARAAGVLVK
jgi:hypothetical protein